LAEAVTVTIEDAVLDDFEVLGPQGKAREPSGFIEEQHKDDIVEIAQRVSEDEQLASFIAQFFDDPLGFVMAAYPWKTDPTIQLCKLPEPWSLVYDSEFGPDAWACQYLEDLGKKIKERGFNPWHAVPVEPIRESVVSGHGIGKSAMVAWLTDFIMSTRPHSRGTVTANTAEQLATKTWAQITKWTNLCITGHWFTITTGKGSMRMVAKESPETWACSAQTCREGESEAFAGQHAPTATSFYIFDEASNVPDIFHEVSEGGLTDGEPMKFAFGNGTRNTGWFKDTFGIYKKRWGNTHIDSRRVQITNKKEIANWIEDHGEDSDYIKVRVRGMFPAQSVKQFISETDVDAAEKRTLRLEQYNFAPKILTLDNAWEGDDEGVIGLRQGLKYETLRTFAKNDNDVVIANLLGQLEEEHQADAVFVDGGYGTGVVSVGRTIGREWMLVWFAEQSMLTGCLNKRAEMWYHTREWLKAGGVIPVDPVLHRDLIGPETVPRLDGKIQIESKNDMKKRKLPSPGRGDALALSFAYPVATKKLRGVGVLEGIQGNANKEHNPYDNLE